MPPISPYYALLALPLLIPFLKTPALPSRESIIKPSAERVILLGASSGVGRDLAHAYAKRGARICLVARRSSTLETVKAECLAFGLDGDRVLVISADVTDTDGLLKIRQTVVDAWGGVDTLHILAGVPSTLPLLEVAGVTLSNKMSSPKGPNPNQRRDFILDNENANSPSKEGMEKVAVEARACGEINYVGTVLALACFLPLLASSSPSPALHHLSSASATTPAPSRSIYSATKAAAFMLVESCRVECEGCGVRFFTLCPGTIANDFRTKTATSNSGGRDETKLDMDQPWEKLLLSPEKVVSTVLENLAINPSPTPLIPYPPFSWFSALNVPPKAVVHLPFMYRLTAFVRDTPLAWLYVEKQARIKYGIPA